MNTFHASRFTSYAFRLAPIAIFICALLLYLRTTAPTLGGAFDSEEFQHAAYNLNVAHATGYPLYLLLGKLFTTLVPIGNIAYRLNLLSAFIGAATVVVVYRNALILTRRQIASVATAALFATNPAVWRQAGVASVGPLHLFLVAAIVYAMLLWHAKRVSLSLAAFLFGLGLAHHRTTLLLAPAIAILVLLDDANILRRPRDLTKTCLWLALPLLLYLYLPIFGGGTPWYSNTLQGFIAEISGGDAGDFIRSTPEQIVGGIVTVAQYLLDSFGYLSIGFVIVGAVSAIRHDCGEVRHSQPFAIRQFLFLGIATLTFSAWGTLYGGEPDRYLVLPFAFLIYWFAIGAGAIEERMKDEGRRMKLLFSSFSLHPSSLRIVFVVILAFMLILPFGDRFRAADWSTFDRVYKQWDEIFTLPIPQNATLVGNWGQLNAMRYMQRVENRRPDLQFVGTLYDPAPQTDAARAAFADGRAIFLSPGIAQPIGDYRYAQLGPLLQVRDAPQMQPPTDNPFPANKMLAPSLTLVGLGLSTALEPYRATIALSVAPARTARVTLYWRADGAVKDFLVRLPVVDPEGRLVAQKDEPPVRALYPASQWQRGEYVEDVHNLLIPPGSPPGRYALKILTIDVETKTPTSEDFAAAVLNIERATNLTREQVFVQHPLDIALNDRVELWGYGGFDGTRRAGETIGISLLWHARENVGDDLTLRLALVDAAGKTVNEWQRAPISFYPTREWQKGEVLKAYYDLQLPDSLAAGVYTFSVGFDSERLAQIAKLEIAP